MLLKFFSAGRQSGNGWRESMGYDFDNCLFVCYMLKWAGRCWKELLQNTAACIWWNTIFREEAPKKYFILEIVLAGHIGHRGFQTLKPRILDFTILYLSFPASDGISKRKHRYGDHLLVGTMCWPCSWWAWTWRIIPTHWDFPEN